MQELISQLDTRILQFDFGNLGSLDYLFNADPGPTEFLAWGIFLSALSIVVSLLISLFVKRFKAISGVRRVLIRSAARRNLILSVVVLLLVIFRGQGFRVVSMRVWVLVTVVLMLVNLGYLIYWWVRRAPNEVKEFKRKSDYQKYLPRKKKS